MPVDDEVMVEVGKRIGRRITELRSERQWSIGRLAKETGVAASTLGLIEKGAMPRVRSLLEIAVALEVTSIEQLFGHVPPWAEFLGKAQQGAPRS